MDSRWKVNKTEKILSTTRESSEDIGVYETVYIHQQVLECQNQVEEENIAGLVLRRAAHESEGRVDIVVEISVGSTYSLAELKANMPKVLVLTKSSSAGKLSVSVSDPQKAGSSAAELFKSLDSLSRFSTEMKKQIVNILNPNASYQAKIDLKDTYFNKMLSRRQPAPFFANNEVSDRSIQPVSCFIRRSNSY